MNICLYTASALPKVGGQELVVDALAREYTRLGHRVTVLAPYPRKLALRDGDMAYSVLRHRRLWSTQYFVAWFRRYLAAAQRERHFDVVHCHDVYPTGYLAALNRAEIGVPLVITSHGGDIRPRNPRLEKPGVRDRAVFALRTADALVSIGQFTDDAFARLVPDAKRVERIPNGVDLSAFAKPVELDAELAKSLPPGEYLLFIGRLHRRKGVDVLLRAFAQLPAEKRIPLAIAGSGEEQEGLEQLVQELGLREQVVFCGRVDGTRKIGLLQNARCVVAPSREWEAFPLVVLEAYAAGKPVIASRIPGLRELVQQDATGMLFTEENSQELSRCLERAATDADWIKRAGEAGRRVAEEHSWGKIAQRHLALYEDLTRLAVREPATP